MPEDQPQHIERLERVENKVDNLKNNQGSLASTQEDILKEIRGALGDQGLGEQVRKNKDDIGYIKTGMYALASIVLTGILSLAGWMIT